MSSRTAIANLQRFSMAVATLLLGGCPPEDDPAGLGGVQESCMLSECHGEIEQIHYGGPDLMCTPCHLGDPDDPTKEGSHVTVDYSFNETTPGSNYLDDPSLYELDEVPLDVIRFLNPSDYRVVRQTCSSSTLGGALCHPRIAEDSLLLNRATLSGQITGGGYLAGTQDKGARYAVVDAVDEYAPGTPLPEHAASFEQIPADPPADITDPVARAFFPVYEQMCLACHLYEDGPKIPGLYYSSGCAGCHVVTDDDARAKTADPTQDIDELGHISTHRFTNLIPDRQCAHCHISHLARSLLAQGVRERSEPEGDAAIGGPNRGMEDPEHARPWGEENYVRYRGMHQIYGKPYPYFIDDEDDTNEVDETPPDVHTAAGMGCIDCHNIREAHGDSTMSIRMDSELDVRCTSCHGRPGELAPLKSDAELSFTRSETTIGGRGQNLPVFETAADGSVLQYVRFTRALHPVTQITQRTDATSTLFNPRTQMGCALHAGTADVKRELKVAVNALASTDPDAVDDQFPGLPAGFTFEVSGEEPDGRVECHTCHNAWTVNCYGCHMVRDDRESYRSALTGEVKQGKVQSLGLSVVADSLAMGFNSQGRISPLVGTAIFFTHIDADGNRPIDAMPLKDGDGNSGGGNVHNPVHHHTIRRLPRDCDGCHPAVDGSHDDDALKTAVGLGSGLHTFVDGSGKTHLLDQLVAADYDGDGDFEDPVSNELPKTVYAVTPLVSTTHAKLADEEAQDPGPLDLETIRRVLENQVVRQRPGVAQ
ncbi:MAG: hypothetical protein JRJ84_17910 [Deltaproteobacteria bacterium]|nr:hypothetical protein [Deltaproteobacteria bacterium]